MGALIDLTGQRYGRLLVVSRHPIDSSGQIARWVCACDCGNQHVCRSDGLRTGSTRSCGCLRKDRGREWCRRVAKRLAARKDELQMINPSKLPSGRWRIEWRHLGVRRSATFDRECDARAAARKITDAVANRKSIAREEVVRDALAALKLKTEEVGAAIMTKQEVAAMLRVNVGMVDGWVRKEEIPFLRISPQTIRFSRADVTAWVAKSFVGDDRAPENMRDALDVSLAKRLPNLGAWRIERVLKYIKRKPPTFGLKYPVPERGGLEE